MVVIHDTISGEAKLAINQSRLSDIDKSGFQMAMKLQDTVSGGVFIYEYASALIAFKKQNSYRWKSILKNAWDTGNYPHGTERIDKLQRYRNIGLL